MNLRNKIRPLQFEAKHVTDVKLGQEKRTVKLISTDISFGVAMTPNSVTYCDRIRRYKKYGQNTLLISFNA
jgi:hypothetical protein